MVRPFNASVDAPSLEEQMTGGSFGGSTGFADEAPVQSMITWADIEEMAAEERQRQHEERQHVERDQPVTLEALSDPASDLGFIVASLSDDALVILANHPDICGANEDRVLEMASEELVRRLVLEGKMPAA